MQRLLQVKLSHHAEFLHGVLLKHLAASGFSRAVNARGLGRLLAQSKGRQVSHATLVQVSHATLVQVSHATLVQVSHATLVQVSHATLVRRSRYKLKKAKESTMNDSLNLEFAIAQSHAALGAILKGDPTLFRTLYSKSEDITLGNPFGPFARGQQEVMARLAGAAANYRDGKVTQVESIARYVSSDLACIVEVECSQAKVGGGAELVSIAVRVTSVFTLEQNGWKLVHRHADPITTPRPAASVINL